MAAPSHGDAERGEVEGQYGAAARGAVRETVTSRAWALGAVVLTCAVLGGAHVMTRQGPAMLATAGKSWVVPAAVPSSAQVTSSLQSAAAERHIERLLKQDVAAEGAELTTLPIHHPGPYMVKKASFTKGEKHMMQEIFPTRASKDELQRDMPSIDQLVPPELLTELENEIAREMEAEVQDAVRKEQQEYYLKSTGTIQAEMDAVMRDVDGQKQINSKFNEMLARAKVLEKDICTSSSQPCKNWDALLAGAQKKADSLKKRLAAETVTRKHALQIERAKERDETAMSYMAEERGESLQEDIKYWQGLANVYFAILHPHTPPPAPAPVPPSPPPPPPPPPHCKGLKVIYGLSGSVSTGPSSSVTDPMHNDCRWIIKSPDSEIVLRFPEIKLPGDEARVSIYVVSCCGRCSAAHWAFAVSPLRSHAATRRALKTWRCTRTKMLSTGLRPSAHSPECRFLLPLCVTRTRSWSSSTHRYVESRQGERPRG